MVSAIWALAAAPAGAAPPEGAHGGYEGDHGAAGAAEHGSSFAPFDASLFPHQLFWLALTFGLLYVLMSRVALPGVASVLEARAARLQRDLDNAASASAAAEAARASAEKAQNDARAEARRIVDEVRASLNAALSEERSKAEAQLAQRKEAAEAQIAAARAQALQNVDAIARELSEEIVDKISRTERKGVAA